MRESAKAAADPRPDDELLLAYRDPEDDDDGRALTTIYHRHREEVLQMLVAEGLSRREAEERRGAVFLRALNREECNLPLRDLLVSEARLVAHDPDWMPVV